MDTTRGNLPIRYRVKWGLASRCLPSYAWDQQCTPDLQEEAQLRTVTGSKLELIDQINDILGWDAHR